ncbi:helix-turn-helix transcriptional regulator [Thalassomonas viridans]|uniref:helix-turn-helix transcriptional regulator n=1 Tax=Thalassomonas viridans TaxID=137584 RepID=UPI000B061D7B|nr:metalloregulator ArsR/SmtB family transcription factor [Thalassomonas viridans]
MEQIKNVDAILAQLKNRGPMTSGSLAEILDMTSMGARQHLLRLEKQQLVSSFSQRAVVGRPKKLWQLTAKAHAKFPDRHADLTLHLIDSVKVIYGDSGLDKLIRAREEKIIVLYKTLLDKCEGLGAKVAALAHQRCEEGYMATVESVNEHEYLLIENHCPICSAAKSCQNFCRSELAIFQHSFGENFLVERQDYLLSGDRRCSYKITSIAR